MYSSDDLGVVYSVIDVYGKIWSVPAQDVIESFCYLWL